MKNMKKKTILMLAAMALLLTVTVGSTIAYLVTSSGPVQNVFEPAYVKSTVIEPGWKDGDLVKNKVTIQNDGNVNAKIRAAIVVTWQDADGNTLPYAPVLETDYSLEIGNDWTNENDYYVWKDTVAPGKQTGTLIESCKQLTNIGTYHLCVEVIGSAIQAEGGADWGKDPTKSE